MILEHMILARDSSIDIDRNTVSVFDLLEEIRLADATPDNFVYRVLLLLVVRREKEIGPIKDKLKLTAVSPDGKKIIDSALVPVEMSAEHRRSRIRINIDVPLSALGDYKFSVKGNGINGSAFVTVVKQK